MTKLKLALVAFIFLMGVFVEGLQLIIYIPTFYYFVTAILRDFSEAVESPYVGEAIPFLAEMFFLMCLSGLRLFNLICFLLRSPRGRYLILYGINAACSYLVLTQFDLRPSFMNPAQDPVHFDIRLFLFPVKALIIGIVFWYFEFRKRSQPVEASVAVL